MAAWDQTHDWVLIRFFNDLTQVTIRFPNGKPTLAELVSIRRCLPQFRNMKPAALREAIGDSGKLPLGAMPTPDARKIIEAAQINGLEVVAESASYISYLPQDRTTGTVLLIEDALEAEAVAQSMLAAGVPIQEVQA